MKNTPQKIFLQTGLKEYQETCEDFKELNSSLISWCSDKIYEDDLEFISVNFIFARIKELIESKEKLKNNPMCSKAEYKAICKNINPLINELKNLIK